MGIDETHSTKRNKVEKASTFGSKTFSTPLKNPGRVRGRRGNRRYRRTFRNTVGRESAQEGAIKSAE